MRISISVTNYSWPTDQRTLGQHLSWLGETADRAGLDTLWVADHLIQADPTAPAGDAEMLEAYTTLGFVAAHTRHVRIGTMVSSVTMRPPALLVKAVTTLDVLSGGRAWLGIGAGYLREEADDMGLTLPPVGERFERLEETLQIAGRMWAGDETAYAGRHYQLRLPHSSPRPLQRPQPRVLVGGTGELRTLRLVAQYADACNLFDIPDEGRTIRHKLNVLARHCEEVGRPFDSIEKTLSTRLEDGESTDSFLERCAAMAELGIDHAVVISSGPWTVEGLATLAAAVPMAAELHERS